MTSNISHSIKKIERKRERSSSVRFGSFQPVRLGWIVCMSFHLLAYIFISAMDVNSIWIHFWVSYSNRLRCKQTHFRNAIVCWLVGCLVRFGKCQTETDNVKNHNAIIKNGSANWFHSVFDNFPLALLPSCAQKKDTQTTLSHTHRSPILPLKLHNDFIKKGSFCVNDGILIVNTSMHRQEWNKYRERESEQKNCYFPHNKAN